MHACIYVMKKMKIQTQFLPSLYKDFLVVSYF